MPTDTYDYQTWLAICDDVQVLGCSSTDLRTEASDRLCGGGHLTRFKFLQPYVDKISTLWHQWQPGEEGSQIRDKIAQCLIDLEMKLWDMRPAPSVGRHRVVTGCVLP